MTSKNLAIAEDAGAVAPANLTPMAILAAAIDRGASPEALEKISALAERWRDAEARRLFDEAMSKVRAELPMIIKSRETDFTSKRTGERTNYAYEDLPSIAKIVDPIVAKYGIDYRFGTRSLENGKLEVSCIVTGFGHREVNSLTADPDTSGSKNPAQALGSIQTYLMRYTLKAALGLATGRDTDANYDRKTATLSADQVQELSAAMTERGVPLDEFIAWVSKAQEGVQALSDISAGYFESCMTAVRSYKKKGATS